MFRRRVEKEGISIKEGKIMKIRRRKLTAFILILAMIMQSFSGYVFADETAGGITEPGIEEKVTISGDEENDPADDTEPAPKEESSENEAPAGDTEEDNKRH